MTLLIQCRPRCLPIGCITAPASYSVVAILHYHARWHKGMNITIYNDILVVLWIPYVINGSEGATEPSLRSVGKYTPQLHKWINHNTRKTIKTKRNRLSIIWSMFRVCVSLLSRLMWDWYYMVNYKNVVLQSKKNHTIRYIAVWR